MLPEELVELVQQIRSQQSETQTIEIKAAAKGCPTRLYDSLSSFSNQDEGGTIVFGIDEQHAYNVAGVYDVQDLQKHVTEQCVQMEPPVRAIFTVAKFEGKHVVSAEIPGIDPTDRPCFYTGKGRLKGSYVRVGESDEPMTEYEVYSYEAFRKKYEDEVEPVTRSSIRTLDQGKLARYLAAIRATKPNLGQLDDASILELMSITRGENLTRAGVMLLSLYPQAFFPQLCIIATVVPGNEVGQVDTEGNRFVDNKRIEGTLDEQLEGALAFVRVNTRTATYIDNKIGVRKDRSDYPVEAVRELVLNALIHRDYSTHTQGMPIQLQIFPEKLVICNPGGLYGRISINDLGVAQPDTRNPVIATAMETLGLTENRYSGIPTVRRLLKDAGMKEPVFESVRGEFRATLYCGNTQASRQGASKDRRRPGDRESDILSFCAEQPRSRAELAELLGLHPAYAMRQYVKPLVERGLLEETLPETPSSPRQRYRLAR